MSYWCNQIHDDEVDYSDIIDECENDELIESFDEVD